MVPNTAADPLTQIYPALAALPPEALALLRTQSQQVEVPPGTTLFDEQQSCQAFPFVLGGAIRVFKIAPNGRELPLYRVTPGETCVISSGCLLGHRAYNARGLTEEPTVLLLVPRETFDTLLQHVAFRTFVFQLFSERLAELMQLIEEVAFHRLDQRLAALLLGHGRVVHATHQQLADELGSVREMVSRLLKGFAMQGMVSMGREAIEIRDATALRRLAEAQR